MKCDEIREKISCMLDNELSAEDSAIVTEHLTTCPECMNVFEAFHAISLSMETLEDEPDGFTEAVMERIHENVNTRKRKPIIKLFAAAAACFAIILLTGTQIGLLPIAGGGNKDNGGTTAYTLIRSAEPTEGQIETTSLVPEDTDDTTEAQPESNDIMPMAISVENDLEAASTPADLSVLLNGISVDTKEIPVDMPVYEVTVADANSNDVHLQVWFDEERIYCKNIEENYAYYVELDAQTQADLQTAVETIQPDAVDPIGSQTEVPKADDNTQQ